MKKSLLIPNTAENRVICNSSAAPVSLRQIRLWAQEDEAADRRLRNYKETLRIKSAENKAIQKAREAAKAQEEMQLVELAHRETENLQFPRRMIMRNESSVRDSISFEELQAILAIQWQMISAFLTLVDKKVPMLLPGARLSTVEESRTLQDIFSESNRRSTLFSRSASIVKRKPNLAVPNAFVERRVFFNSENRVIVFDRASTPSLRR